MMSAPLEMPDGFIPLGRVPAVAGASPRTISRMVSDGRLKTWALPRDRRRKFVREEDLHGLMVPIPTSRAHRCHGEDDVTAA